MNINLAISLGSKILRNNFITSSQLDSEILMAKTINKDRKYILLNSNNVLKKSHLNNILNLSKYSVLFFLPLYLIYHLNLRKNHCICMKE